MYLHSPTQSASQAGQLSAKELCCEQGWYSRTVTFGDMIAFSRFRITRLLKCRRLQLIAFLALYQDGVLGTVKRCQV